MNQSEFAPHHFDFTPSHLGILQTAMSYHKPIVPILWLIVVPISIFVATYSYRRYSFYIHALAGWTTLLLTLGTSIPIVADHGFNSEHQNYFIHKITGACFDLILLILCIIGSSSRFLQQNPTSQSQSILRRKLIHKILGYLLWFIGLFQCWLVYKRQEMVFLSGAIFAILMALRKIFFPTLQKAITTNRKGMYNQNPQIQKIGSLKQLDMKYSNYIIFANYVYNSQLLKTEHPAGWQILSNLNHQQVDRYVYGMYSNDSLPEIAPHSHSFKSFDMLGLPIAKLTIPSVFTGFDSEFVQMKVVRKKVISAEEAIQEIDLIPKEGQMFKFTSYTELRQFGRCYALTVDGSTTRLYTYVNFLHPQNIKLLSNLLNPLPPSFPSSALLADIMATTNYSQNYIPLLIKRYPKGKLTPKLIDGSESKITLSSARGSGLRMETLPQGKVIIVCGGTGLYPFSDLIDTLFKNKFLRNSRNSFTTDVATLTPVLQTHYFQDHTYLLLGAFNHISDIHPITLAELIDLSNDELQFNVKLRIKDGSSTEEIKNNTKIQLTSDQFENILSKEINAEAFSMIWVCGPPKMNQQLLKMLKQQNVPQEKYMIV